MNGKQRSTLHSDIFLVMPFCLTNAPAVFQSLINDVLRDMLNSFVFVYLDDILIFSRDHQEHHRHVRLVLQWLLENRLFKAEIQEGQICSDPAKVKAVLEWPFPVSRRQLLVPGVCSFVSLFHQKLQQGSDTSHPTHLHPAQVQLDT